MKTRMVLLISFLIVALHLSRCVNTQGSETPFISKQQAQQVLASRGDHLITGMRKHAEIFEGWEETEVYRELLPEKSISMQVVIDDMTMVTPAATSATRGRDPPPRARRSSEHEAQLNMTLSQ